MNIWILFNYFRLLPKRDDITQEKVFKPNQIVFSWEQSMDLEKISVQ